MRLYQPVAVQQDAVTPCKRDLSLFIEKGKYVVEESMAVLLSALLMMMVNAVPPLWLRNLTLVVVLTAVTNSTIVPITTKVEATTI